MCVSIPDYHLRYLKNCRFERSLKSKGRKEYSKITLTLPLMKAKASNAKLSLALFSKQQKLSTYFFICGTTHLFISSSKKISIRLQSPICPPPPPLLPADSRAEEWLAHLAISRLLRMPWLLLPLEATMAGVLRARRTRKAMAGTACFLFKNNA